MSQHPIHTLEELSAILDALPDYVFVVEVEAMCVIYANRAFTALIGGGEKTTLVGESLYDLYPAEMAETFIAQNKEVVATRQTMHILETLNMPSRTIYADTYKTPLYGADGEVYAVLGTSRDLTEMEQMRQTLARRTQELEQTNQLLIASGGFLQSVLDSQSSSIAVIHADGSIRVINAHWRRLAAENPNALKGRDGLGLNYFALCSQIVGGDAVIAEELERGLRALLGDGMEAPHDD